MTVTLSRDGLVQSHNAFDADFDEMVLATETIVRVLSERLSNRKYCPYSHGGALRTAALPPSDAKAAEMVEKLRRRERAAVGGTTVWPFINPDGPEAATLIASQAARIVELEADNALLTEENGWMREALIPSDETKAAYIGEFSFDIVDWSDDGELRPGRVVSVPWTTIKEIMAAIRARAASRWLSSEGEGVDG